MVENEGGEPRFLELRLEMVVTGKGAELKDQMKKDQTPAASMGLRMTPKRRCWTMSRTKESRQQQKRNHLDVATVYDGRDGKFIKRRSDLQLQPKMSS
eukprot:346374-Hanusia_phi.AAC.2